MDGDRDADEPMLIVSSWLDLPALLAKNGRILAFLFGLVPVADVYGVVCLVGESAHAHFCPTKSMMVADTHSSAKKKG